MKKIIFFIGFLFIALHVNAQQEEVVKVGDVMKISTPANGSFKHIHFPRKNIIIKRGGIANFKSVYGHKVVISRITQKNDGSTLAILKRADGGKFFGAFSTLKARADEAITSGELLPL